jgi:hypothetical protein
MPGLKARILSRRANGAPHTAPLAEEEDAPTTDLPTVVMPAPTDQPADPGETTPEPSTAAVATVEPEDPTAVDVVAVELPAGAEPSAPARPSSRERGRLRRRLRYLRRIRELGFRDLGGLVFDLDRFGRDRQDLVRAKLDALSAIDGELRGIEAALGDERPVEELYEPGVSSCAHCGALHGSEARFCPSCGRPAGTSPAAPEPPAAAPAAEVAPVQPAACAKRRPNPRRPAARPSRARVAARRSAPARRGAWSAGSRRARACPPPPTGARPSWWPAPSDWRRSRRW